MNDYSHIPPGSYKGRPTCVRAGCSSNGNTYLEVDIDLLDGPCAGEPVTRRLYFTERALKLTRRELIGLGVKNFDEIADGLLEMAHETGTLPGIGTTHVSVVMGLDSNGEVAVRFINPLAGSSPGFDFSAAAEALRRFRAGRGGGHGGGNTSGGPVVP